MSQVRENVTEREKNKHTNKMVILLGVICLSVLLVGALLLVYKRLDHIQMGQIVAEDGTRLQGIRIPTDEEILAPYTGGVLSIGSQGITVYWKKPEYVDGYLIWRCYNGKFYSLIAKIPEETDSQTEPFLATGFYTDSNFNRNKEKVKYCITSYRNTDKGIVSSKFPKKITAKRSEELKTGVKHIALPIGEKRMLRSYVGWDDVEATWTSDDESILSVSENGEVTALQQGNAKVRCSYNGQEAEVTIYVNRQEDTILDGTTQRYHCNEDGIWEADSSRQDQSAVIMMAGDLMCMGGQQKSMYSDEEGFNFNESYAYVKDVLAYSDLAVGNLETVLSAKHSYSGDEGRIDGKPNCNAPARYLDAISYGGFDGLIMANNHNCDVGVEGTVDTIEQVDRYGFGHTGLFTGEEKMRGMIYDVNGIKVGFLAYVGASCHFNMNDADWSQSDVDKVLNYFEKEKARRDIEELRQNGAEYVIVYMHWGVTDHFGIKQSQKEAAQDLADVGADYIVGAHPHVIQTYMNITSADGKVVPCAFSLGDFNGYVNQVDGNLDTVLLTIRLKKQSDGSVVLDRNTYIPFLNIKEYEGHAYASVPISDKINGDLHLKEENKVRERVIKRFGNDIQELTDLNEIKSW